MVLLLWGGRQAGEGGREEGEGERERGREDEYGR